jgi:hypothetical protein
MQPQKSIRLDHIPTDIQRNGSETTKIRLIGSFMLPQKTDENDCVITEIQHNGSFGDKNI